MRSGKLLNRFLDNWLLCSFHVVSLLYDLQLRIFQTLGNWLVGCKLCLLDFAYGFGELNALLKWPGSYYSICVSLLHIQIGLLKGINALLKWPWSYYPIHQFCILCLETWSFSSFWCPILFLFNIASGFTFTLCWNLVRTRAVFGMLTYFTAYKDL